MNDRQCRLKGTAAYQSKPPDKQPELKIRKFYRCLRIFCCYSTTSFSKQLLCEENNLCFRTYKHIHYLLSEKL